MIHLLPYIAFHCLFLIFLALRVIRIRRKKLIGVGTGKDSELALASGVFDNYAEFTPFAFVLGFAMGAINFSPWMIHLTMATFTLGRILHFLGYSKSGGFSFGRFWGMILTFLSLIIGSLAILIYYLSDQFL